MNVMTLPSEMTKSCAAALAQTHRWEGITMVVISGVDSDDVSVLGVSSANHEDLMRLSDQLRQYANAVRPRP